jgi:voltage-gated potassium channel Kch
VKVFGIMLMFGGIVLIGIIASLLTLFIVSGAAGQIRNEFLAGRLRGQMVVCGLGHVGVAVARGLRARGMPVVVVDPAACDDLHRELHLRCPVIAGDATRPIVLGRAGIGRARAVIACTANDALNLEIGLTAQSLAEHRSMQPLRVVLRCFDADLAHRIHAVSGSYTLLSEAKIAAPRFVDAALDQGRA